MAGSIGSLKMVKLELMFLFISGGSSGWRMHSFSNLRVSMAAVESLLMASVKLGR